MKSCWRELARAQFAQNVSSLELYRQSNPQYCRTLSRYFCGIAAICRMAAPPPEWQAMTRCPTVGVSLAALNTPYALSAAMTWSKYQASPPAVTSLPACERGPRVGATKTAFFFATLTPSRKAQNGKRDASQ